MAVDEKLLDGLRVVVTGASRGLGRAFALGLSSHGAKLVVNGTNQALIDELVSEISEAGGEVNAVVGSVADEDTANAIIAACVDAYGGVDVLINNAGVVRDRTLMRMSVEEFDEVIAVNLRGSWLCGRAAALAMKETGGHIVNVTSNSGLSGSIGQTNYAAAKAGVMGMTRTWAKELARYDIRCNAIWPLAHTDMTQVVVDRRHAAAKESGDPVLTPREMGIGPPEEIADFVVYLCSEHAADLNGQCISTNGQKMAMWSHPQEVNLTERQAWPLADLIADFPTTVGREHQPFNPR